MCYEQKGRYVMFENKHIVLPTDRLRKLCLEKGWFDCGTVELYEKMLEMNEFGVPMDELAAIIWFCTDAGGYSEVDILDCLFAEYLKFYCEQYGC